MVDIILISRHIRARMTTISKGDLYAMDAAIFPPFFKLLTALAFRKVEPRKNISKEGQWGSW